MAYNISPGLLETSLSPDLPDRKRYAIKEKVSLGIYKPSFAVQPDLVFGSSHGNRTAVAEPTLSYFGQQRGIAIHDNKNLNIS